MHGGRWRGDDVRVRRALAGTSIVAAVLPIVVAGIRAAVDGWIPVGEVAYVSVRAADVFTKHPPMLGIHSSASTFAGSMAHHPGPVEMYAIAPWIRVFGMGAGTALGIAFLDTVCVLAVAWLARRRAGLLGVMVAMAAMATLAWSMGSARLFDAWPPHATLLPFAVVLMAGWSVADRDTATLPVLALSASYVLQSHVGYTLLVPGIVVTSCVLYGRDLFRRPTVRWLGVSAALALVSWVPPLYEEVLHKEGNLTLLWRALWSKDAQSISLADAVRLFAGTVALPPWWLPPSFASPAVEPSGDGLPLPVAIVGVVALFTLVGWLARRAGRRGRTTISRGLWFLLAVFVLVIVTLDQALAADIVPVPMMYVRYVWIVSAFTGIVVTLALIDEVRDGRAELFARVRRPALAGLAVVTALAGLLALPDVDHGTVTTPVWGREATRQLADDVLPLLEGDHDGPIYLDMQVLMASAPIVGAGLMAELREHDVAFVVKDEFLVAMVGDHRKFWPGKPWARLSIRGYDAERPSPDAEVVATVAGLSHDEQAELDGLRPVLRAALDDCDDDVPWLGAFAAGEVEDPVDAVAGCDGFPTGDLERYVELAQMRRTQALRVWLDDVPPKG
jgi:hypothetical protein